MHITLTDYLDETSEKFPDNIAYSDTKESFTFKSVREIARKTATAILDLTESRSAVVVYMKKCAAVPVVFMGVSYAGCYYTPIDSQMPLDRVRLILDTLNPSAVIYDKTTKAKIEELGLSDKALSYDDIMGVDIDDAKLKAVRENASASDLLYVFFTSGSTGVPKGVTISHLAAIDCMEWVCREYGLDENTKVCNEAPFYFDLSVIDVFIPLKSGGRSYFPPKSYFTFPVKVLQFIEENSINFINWVPSAYCNVVNCNALEVCAPKCIKHAIFVGEVMPCRHLNVWRSYMPDTLFINGYGPTEATYCCMFYNITRDFSDEEVLPLGIPCENTRIYLLNENNRQAAVNELGEICITGPSLSFGYYNNPEKTDEAFVQNPLNSMWHDPMYRTGDLAFINEAGEMVFAGRKDFQIKRLGYRIELGEIENAITAVEGIETACCIFDQNTKDIIAVYTGSVAEESIMDILTEKIPAYMMPNKFICLQVMPMNLNGKIDRPALKKQYIG